MFESYENSSSPESISDEQNPAMKLWCGMRIYGVEKSVTQFYTLPPSELINGLQVVIFGAKVRESQSVNGIPNQRVRM